MLLFFIHRESSALGVSSIHIGKHAGEILRVITTCPGNDVQHRRKCLPRSFSASPTPKTPQYASHRSALFPSAPPTPTPPSPTKALSAKPQQTPGQMNATSPITAVTQENSSGFTPRTVSSARISTKTRQAPTPPSALTAAVPQSLPPSPPWV